MMKKLLSRYGFQLAALALTLGQISAYLPCKGDFYQPKVPKELLK